MNKIIFPLEVGKQGFQVRDLQEALIVLLKRGAITTANETELRQLLEGIEAERITEKYGERTAKVVEKFQAQLHLNRTGNVDEPTATRINKLLEEGGLLGPQIPAGSFVVSGRVSHKNGPPLKGRVVRAFHVTDQFSIRLGEDTTDAEGSYSVRYEPLPGNTSINLRVSVQGDDGEPQASSEIIVNAEPLQIVNLVLPEIKSPIYRVFGNVRDAQGELLTGVTVKAFDRDLRSELPLGSADVQNGHYEIHYTQSQLHPSKKLPDLVLKVVRQEAELHATTIHHHSPREFELNLTISGSEYKGPSEWESLEDTLTPLLQDLSPLELREDENFKDFSFLAGETGKDRVSIAMWAMCFRLADRTQREQMALAPEVLFGFLRQGQPIVSSDNLIEDMRHADRLTLLEDRILSGIAAIEPGQRRSLLETAFANNLIPGRFRPQIDDIFSVLHRIHLRYTAQKTFGGGKGTIDELLELTPEAKAKQAEFLTAFTAHKGAIKEFWKSIAPGVLSDTTVEKVQRSFELGALVRNHIPLVKELVRQFDNGEHSRKRELARLSRQEWTGIFKKQVNGESIGVPANIDGESTEQQMEQFAAILERQFERVYPTASFAGKLSRNELSPLRSTADMVRFFDNNADLQLDRVRLDQYLADVEHPNALEGIQNKEAVLAELKSVQRVFKLDPTFKAVKALLTRNIDSSQQIYFMGESQFLTALADSEVNKIEAKRLYRKAENAYAYALALYGDHNIALNGPSPHGVPSMIPNVADQGKIALLPNLTTLFGSLDYCECIHCRSVYSPAAYFIDVMRFLGKRGTQINPVKNVRDVLLERRPDLGEIEMSCENTNTPLPYIDLVNEILEDMVAPPPPIVLSGAIEPDLTEGVIKPSVLNALNGKEVPISVDARVLPPDSLLQWAIRDAQQAYKISKSGSELHLFQTRQTFLSATELRANPEYTNAAAYDRLMGEVYPLNLPFDLWQIQVRTYLDHLGVSQPRLQTLFQQTQPTDVQIDCSWLGITEKERQILTGTLSSKQPWDYWGLQETGNNLPNPSSPDESTANITGTWIDVLSNVNVMLNRSGLAYKELLQLLDMHWVNPEGSIFVFDTEDPNTTNCDTSNFTIRNLTGDGLNRMHRFIRLWRKLGCQMWELDLWLPQNNSDSVVPDDALQAISRVRRLQDQINLDWRVIRSFYNEIDHRIYIDRARDGAQTVQTLYQRLFRNKLVDAVASFPPGPGQITGRIEENVPGILAAFRIKEVGLNLILADLGGSMTSNLDISILSKIYRVTALAKSLTLNIDQFLQLKRMWLADPFVNQLATLEFVELVQQINASNFTVIELDYLLHHQYTPSSGVAIDDKTIISIVQSIREGLQRIDDGLRLKAEETKEAYVKSKLGLLPALTKDSDQVTALGITNGTWDKSDAERDAFIDKLFVDLNPPEAKTKLAKIPSGLTPDEYQSKVNERFDYVQRTLEEFLLRTEKENFILQKVSEVMQLEVPSMNLLLRELLVVPSTVVLQTIDDPRLIEKVNGAYRFEISIERFPDIFKSLRLLHKNAMVIGKLQMKAVDVLWWLNNTHTDGMGWMKPNHFPTEFKSDGSNRVDLTLWLAMQQFFAWKEELPKSEVTALEFASDLMDESKNSDQILTSLAKVTGWSEIDLKSFRTAFQWVDSGTTSAVIRGALRKSTNLARLAECMKVLQRLGVSAERALKWAKAEPDSDDADSLKQTVKAKYDLKQWLQIIQPIQDEFREQKRHALVSWLVAHPSPGQNWSDANGLYSYFLIDVEMSACMLTSRIKQAAASVQLFVQRCLLNIEKDILAKTDVDSKWKQWKWMKQYRVWEANRKVFLYPENWIEPELRDEKSPFFKELENELVQNDITNETAEQAYLNYLEKLDQVANLEIRAHYNQEISSGEPVLHVFGRTRSSQAPTHFYRKRINAGRWTPWEKVELDINADQLMAGIHNRRLYLMWPQFLTKADKPTSGSNEQPYTYWEVRLFWSELKKGKWTPKVLSDSFVRVNHDEIGGEQAENIVFSAKFGTDVLMSIARSRNPDLGAPFSVTQHLTKVGKQINRSAISVREVFKAPTESQYSSNLLKHNQSSLYFGHYSHNIPLGLSIIFPVEPKDHAASSKVLGKIRGTTYSAVNLQGGPVTRLGTFFVWDSDHVYAVDYGRSEDQVSTSGGWRPVVSAVFKFFIHYHPFVELFIKELNIWGIKGLLNRRIQVSPPTIPSTPPAFKFEDYQPTGEVSQIHKLPDGTFSYPIEEVDFSYLGAYASYNWELFFHVPFFIANKLSANQRFEEALEWFHYIFDPTSTDNTEPDSDTPQQKFWVTKPFYETTKDDYYKQRIENIMVAIAEGDVELRKQVEEWRDNAFSPHLIARLRTTAYQKNVLLKYIQTLIAWGDQLFRRDTIESINEATQLYILAAEVLGPRPKSIPRKEIKPPKTFYQLQKEGIDDFGNLFKEVENLLPIVSDGAAQGEDAPELPHIGVFYFGIPNNDKLLTLWDTVADRLFKIRHCMNIEGVVRQLPLFEPPIDPALLVRATAAGLDISAAISDMNAPLPQYRFSFMIQRALEICNDVKSLGGAMLAALEKRDAEAFALLRSSHEQVMLDRVRFIKSNQVEEALRSKEALDESKKIIEARRDHYKKLIDEGWNVWEKVSLGLTGGAVLLEGTGVILDVIGAALALIPELDSGATGPVGTPTVKAKIGGTHLKNSLSGFASSMKGLASIAQMGAGMTSTVASFARRNEDWEFQNQIASKELPQVEKQITAADIRHQNATQELANHDQQIENAQKEDEYLRSKFTNQELYDWMLSQISTVYFQSYQLAYDIAKRAERSFRYEIGLSDSSYIQFGYWDTLKKGLLSGEKLHYDLKRLEASYYEQNRREFELTKHISLSQLDPVALLKLKQNGECFLDIPETVFDMDYPGHYFRRLKSVGLSIPCVTGPYTTVACTLTLISNQLRKDSTLLNTKYPRDLTIEDPRFRDEIAAIQSIATSNAQNDHGMFELNFRDERYLPFEGAGAISSWQIKLNKDFPQFDYATISDVIIHLSYTARDGGENLRSAVVKDFDERVNELALREDRKGLFRVFDLKREFSTQWSKFLHPSTPADDQTLVLDGLENRLPFFTRKFSNKKVGRVEVWAKMKKQANYELSLSALGDEMLPLVADSTIGGLHHAVKDLEGSEINFGVWTMKIREDVDADIDFKSLPTDAIEELFLIINYSIA